MACWEDISISALLSKRQLMMCARGEEVIPRVRGRDHHGLALGPAHLDSNFRPYTSLFRNLSEPLFTDVKMGIIAPS